jgi:hypothetical protein
VACLGLKDFQVQPGEVFGGVFDAQGTVVLSDKVPAGGAGVAVALANSNPAVATVDGSVTVAAASDTVTFPIPTHGSIDGTNITAILGAAITRPLRSQGVQSLVVDPDVVTGGGHTHGTVTLSAPAPPQGVTVTLNSDALSATLLSPTLTFHHNESTKTFTIDCANTFAEVAISASLGGRTVSAQLSLNRLA